MFERQRLVDLYYSGIKPTLHFIDELLDELADQERLLGHRQQRMIDAQRQTIEKFRTQYLRAKDKIEHLQVVNHQLKRRVQELQAALAASASQSQGAGVQQVTCVDRDSHNSSLAPSSDMPGAKAKNAARRNRSLRRYNGRHVGGQPGHRGVTLNRVEVADKIVSHRPQQCLY